MINAQLAHEVNTSDLAQEILGRRGVYCATSFV